MWDLSDGGKQLLKLEGHTEGVRGCSLSADGSRAITCSMDDTAIVWDLSDGGKQLLKLEGHTGGVRGCSLSADGSRAIAYSGDKTIHIWDLSDSGKELVEYRRYHDSMAWCAVLGPASCGNSKYSAFVGLGNGEANVFDINLGYDPSTNLVWENFMLMERDQFTAWLTEVVTKRRSARFLFQPDRTSGGKTLIHKLAALEHGMEILQRLQDAVAAVGDDNLAGSMMGLLKHAQAEPGVCAHSPLVDALQAPGQENAEFLLEDYLEYAEQGLMASHIADATGMHLARGHLSERDLIVLFRTYPALAASFLEKLSLHQTGMVKTTTRCDFEESSNATLIEDDTSVYPAGKHEPNVKTTAPFQFWENVITRRQESQEAGEDGVFVTSHMVPVTATTESVPHVPMHHQQDDRMERANSEDSSVSEADGSITNDQQQPSVQDKPPSTRLGIEYDKLLMQEPEDSSVAAGSCDMPTQRPPFSQLLEAAVAHVDRTRQPLVFEGPTLQTIVQHKWETSCRAIFMLMFQAYAVFLAMFAITTLLFASWLESESDLQHSIAWSSWGFCLVYSLLLLKRECHQVRAAILVLGLDQFATLRFH
eukprot:COSAG06_NODE_7107_length_2631_cov_10.619273_1_plen_592_part_00